MHNIQLEIRDTTNSVIGVIDIKDHDSFPLSLNFTISDIMDMEARSGSYTKTFNVPATKNNNKLLNFIFNTGLDDGKKIREQKKCIVKVDGMVMMRGYIKVKNVITTNGLKEYVLNIFGNNSEWVDLLADKKINTLSLGTHTYNKTAIEASWSADYPASNYFYPLVNYGQWKFTANLQGNMVVTEDLRPAVYIKALFIEGFESIGYKIASDFLNINPLVSGSASFFDKLILPFHSNNWKPSTTSKDNSKFRASGTQNILQLLSLGTSYTATVAINDDSTSPNFDTGSNFNTSTYQFTSPENAYYRFQGRVTIENKLPAISSAYTPYLSVKTSGGTVIYNTYLVNVSGGGVYIGANSTLDIDYDLSGIRMNATDTIELIIISQGWVDAIQQAHDFTITASMYNEMSDQITQGQTVDLATIQDEDLTVLDIINGVSHSFNLYFWTDTGTKTVYIEPRETFFNNFSSSVDWTTKIDNQNYKISYIDSYKREVNFKYVDDSSDGYVTERNEIMSNTLAEYKHTFSDRFKKGEQLMANPLFAPTYHLHDRRITYQPFAYTSGNIANISHLSAPLIARMWADYKSDLEVQDNIYDHAPRMLYKSYGTQLDADGNAKRWFWGGDVTYTGNITTTPTTTTKTYIPTGLMEGFTDVTQENLSYNYTNGLFDKYYDKYTKVIEKGIFLEAQFYLNIKDINDINIKNPIYIDAPSDLKGYWIINKVNDFNPLNIGLTTVELVKVENLGSSTLDPDQLTGTHNREGYFAEGDAKRGGRRSKMWSTTSSIDISKNEQRRENYERPSLILNNGTGNMAKEGQSNIALGQGVMATGTDQTVLGRFNDPSSTDIFQVGVGADEESRTTALKVDSNGVFSVYGGDIYVEIDGIVQPLLMEDDVNEGYVTVYKK